MTVTVIVRWEDKGYFPTIVNELTFWYNIIKGFNVDRFVMIPNIADVSDFTWVEQIDTLKNALLTLKLNTKKIFLQPSRRPVENNHTDITTVTSHPIDVCYVLSNENTSHDEYLHLADEVYTIISPTYKEFFGFTALAMVLYDRMIKEGL